MLTPLIFSHKLSPHTKHGIYRNGLDLFRSRLQLSLQACTHGPLTTLLIPYAINLVGQLGVPLDKSGMAGRELFILRLEILQLGGELGIKLPQGGIGSEQVVVPLLLVRDLPPQLA